MKLERNNNYTFKAMIESGDAEYPGCVLHLDAFGWRVTFKLPPIIKPDVLKVRGHYNFDELVERRYGIYLFENHLNVCYGRGDANFYRDEFGKEQRWSCFLPWNEWRHVRHSLYDVQGREFCHKRETPKLDRDTRRLLSKGMMKMEELCPKAKFTFKDFDGEEITATTRIEEREWRRGKKWFKWLSFFWPAKISRSLDIAFSSEVGHSKGSWKGGTVGHSIELLPGELHEAAFRRYCQKYKLRFTG